MVQLQLAYTAVLAGWLVTTSAPAQQSRPPAGARSDFHVPVEYHTLTNGLRPVERPRISRPEPALALATESLVLEDRRREFVRDVRGVRLPRAVEADD